MSKCSIRQATTGKTVLGVAVVCLAAASARAATSFTLDLDSVFVQATNASNANVPFTGASFTGNLNLSFDNNSFLTMDVDDVNQPTSGTLTSLSGAIGVSQGRVTGGNVSVVVTSGGAARSYTLSIVADPQTAVIASGSPQNPVYVVFAATQNGTFSSDTFAGVNVSDFRQAPLDGGFILENYHGNAGNGGDGLVNLQFTAETPEPAALAVGAVSCGLLLRRRRVRAGRAGLSTGGSQ